MNETSYILGHSGEELRRLELQATILESLMRRLLSEAGLVEGMSVLDIGTGAGDVAILAATKVGPAGRVLGVDRNRAALDRARARAENAKLTSIRWQEIDFAPGRVPGTFDFVVGRYVLMHQSDPVAFLRQAASQVEDGGVLALLEMAQLTRDRYSVPPVARYDEAMVEILTAFSDARADLDIGSRLISLFERAGLGEPSLIADTPVGGASSVIPEWVALTRQNCQSNPQSETVAWRPLAEAFRNDAMASQSQLFGPRNVAAWVRISRAG